MLDIATTEGLFLSWDFFILIATATILGFIAHKTKQPNIIAYIFTGLILGPVGLEAIKMTHFTELISELGLVFLLFLIGLEINLDKIKKIIKPITLMALAHMTLTFLAGFLTAFLMKFKLIESLFIGAAVMFGSTALIVKLLADNDETSSLPGRLDIGMLLIEDIVVVLILAIIETGMGSPYSMTVKFLEIVGFIAVISAVSILFSRHGLPFLFKRVKGDLRTLFIYGVAWAFAFIALAQKTGISMEIGAFIAGIGLAQLPRSTELRERVRPLTNLFMAVFFINFGLNISPGQISAVFFKALAASAILMVSKFGFFVILMDRLKFTPETNFIASINMTQVSEFGLILTSLALSKGLIGGEVLGFISIVAIVTMGSSSYLINYSREIYEKVKHLFEFLESEEKGDMDIQSLDEHAVIVGYDELTKSLIPVLQDAVDDVVVIDKGSKYINEANKSDVEFVFGDLKHNEMRRNIGLKRAKIVISVVREDAVNRMILEDTPDDALTLIRAKDRKDAADLYDLGANFVILKRMLAADKMKEYLEAYLESPDLFEEKIKGDKQKINWEARSK